VHESIRPGTALLRLTTTHERQGILDGAWWPRSRDVAAELPGLITALTERLGPITRIGLDSAAWNELPTRVTVDDRAVRIDSFAVGDDTALVTRGDQDLFALLVVPPETPVEAARAAMAEAVQAGNEKPARQILIETSADRPSEEVRVEYEPLPSEGHAEVRIVAASPEAARRVAEVLRRCFASTEQRSYPAGREGGTRLHLTLDTARTAEPAQSWLAASTSAEEPQGHAGEV
jgi:hypothetical protein